MYFNVDGNNGVPGPLVDTSDSTSLETVTLPPAPVRAAASDTPLARQGAGVRQTTSCLGLVSRSRLGAPPPRPPPRRRSEGGVPLAITVREPETGGSRESTPMLGSFSSEDDSRAGGSEDETPRVVVSPVIEELVDTMKPSKRRPAALLLQPEDRRVSGSTVTLALSPASATFGPRQRRSYPVHSTGAASPEVAVSIETAHLCLPTHIPSPPSNPPSPTLSSLSPVFLGEPLSRVAAGLVNRRGLSSSLPTSQGGFTKFRAVSTPTLGTRKISFAAEARLHLAQTASKLEDEDKAAARAGLHSRSFSWPQRPEEGSFRKTRRWPEHWKRDLLLMVVVSFFSWRFHPFIPDQPAARPRYTGGSKLLKDYVSGRAFDINGIHGGGGAQRSKIQRFINVRPATITSFSDRAVSPPPRLDSPAQQRDTVVVYRILGNDLPPRHSPGQTLRNLRFLLDHESDFSALPPLGTPEVDSNTLARPSGGLKVDKYYVLNRIVDAQTGEAIRQLLQSYGVPESRILVIPFNFAEYQSRGFRWDQGLDAFPGWGVGGVESAQANGPVADAGPDPEEVGAPWQAKALGLDSQMAIARLRAVDFLYHEKNLYVMNNNGGRNFAVEHGRALPHSRWILALDGNSFFTPTALAALTSTLSDLGEGLTAARYVVIPMTRLLANDDVLVNNSISRVSSPLVESGATTSQNLLDLAPTCLDEPQIGFRFDSTDQYDSAMRYGRRSKLELLWRLGAVPRSLGLDTRVLPWEHSQHVGRWGSIPGAVQLDSADSSSGLAFVRAGWVYRLFAGDQSQELVTPESKVLRRTNRIKGIVAFLEHLDDRVVRGERECSGDVCGFRPERLWTVSQEAMHVLRREYEIRLPSAVQRLAPFIAHAQQVAQGVQLSLVDGAAFDKLDPQWAAAHALVLALAGHLARNISFSALAISLIQSQFLRPPAPLSAVQRAQLASYHHFRPSYTKPTAGEDAPGYASPPPLPNYPARWSSQLAFEVVSHPEVLPFDPLEFDPTPLLDAVRILSLSTSSPVNAISRALVDKLAMWQLSFLLFAPNALARSASPATLQEGVQYDLKVATLGAFLGDGRLVGRVVNRARLRVPGSQGIAHIEAFAPLLRGLINARYTSLEIARGPPPSLDSFDSPLTRLGI